MMSDLDTLVSAAQKGDIDAFGAVVTRFQGMAQALAYNMVGDAQLAEDAAQEAFLEAYFALPNLREPAAFSGWFRRIVFKHCDRLVRGRHLLTVPLDMASDVVSGDPEPVAELERHELQTIVHRAVALLPEHERLVTLLFYMAGHSYQEIAAFLELPLSTVKKRLHDARRHLRAIMPQELLERRVGRWTPPTAILAERLQLLIAVRTGDLPRVGALLAGDPSLVHTREALEDWTPMGGGQQYRPLGGGYTPLHWAATAGNLALAQLLLSCVADVEARTGWGETPLHRAILHRQREIARLLLVHAADPNAPAATGMTPLHYAVLRDDYDAALLLLAAGADPNAAGAGGRTPLHWAQIKRRGRLAQLFVSHKSHEEAHDEPRIQNPNC